MTPSAQREAMIDRVRRALPAVRWRAQLGSVARGAATAASDVDVALLARGPVEARTRHDLRGDLEEAVQRDIRLVDAWPREHASRA